MTPEQWDPAAAGVLRLPSGRLVAVAVDGLDLQRVLRAVWRPPRALSGPAGELVRLITRTR